MGKIGSLQIPYGLDRILADTIWVRYDIGSYYMGKIRSWRLPFGYDRILAVRYDAVSCHLGKIKCQQMCVK